MNINPSWNYKEIVKNIRTLRHNYECVLASFNYVRHKNNFIRETRNNLYETQLEEFQKDRIWEYMNGDLSQLDTFVFFGFFEFDKED